MRKTIVTAFAMGIAALSSAQLRTARIFADSMVLQRGVAIPVWGWANKGEKVTVRFNQQSKTTQAGADGKWRVDLAAEKEGGPYQLHVSGSTEKVLTNILVGDVWVCSGQSNMEWIVANVNHAKEEIASADLPMIRHTKIPLTVAGTPQADLPASNGWHTATPANVGNFTAVGYFFAKQLYESLHVPIGLINTTWGGTHVETWTSREALENSSEFKEMMTTFPVLNLDSVAVLKKNETIARIRNLQGALPTADEARQWKEAGYATDSWSSMKLPGLWETQALPNVDGVVWLRKEITVSAADNGKPADLLLSMIDDNDETFVNGKKIGATHGYNVKRLYKIPAGILHEGKNTIAVRVEDTGGGGGVYGDAGDVKINFSDHAIALNGDWKYRVESVMQTNTVGPNSYPTLLYNAMLHPLLPYAIKGAIWYQGESNAGRAWQYRTAFPLMITDWRRQWKQGDFPFYFVQLASYNASGGTSENGSTWAELREAQTQTLSLPNTGMAVTIDIGEAKDIHPRNKQDVGKRLAAVALHKTYGQSNEYSGPVYKSMRIDGDKIILTFDHKGTGLITTDPEGKVKGFEIAGADRKFVTATAMIEGDHLVVSAAGVKNPVAVRYAWADFAGEANLYNLERFPAVPFRTDNWKGVTEGVKYAIGQ